MNIGRPIFMTIIFVLAVLLIGACLFTRNSLAGWIGALLLAWLAFGRPS